MFDILYDYIKKIVKSRLTPLILVYFILFAILMQRIFYLQIVKSDDITGAEEELTIKEREIKATRGNIYDRNQKLLAYNELSYSITLEDIGAFDNNADRNAMIHQLIQIIEQNNGKLANEFYMEFNHQGKLVFNVEGTAELRFKKNVYSLKSVNDLSEEQKNATAEELFEYMRHGNRMFDISEEYSMEEALKIMTVRYAMMMNNYYKYLPITVAADVNDRIVVAIKENSASLPGVEVQQETNRVYPDSIYFSHILGYTGLINESELESNNEKEEIYSATDQIGKTSLEKKYEEYLKGTKGYERVAINNSRRVTDVLETVQPVAGNDLYLTIDGELQKACYQILEHNLAEILLSRIHSGSDSGGKGVNSSKITIPIYDVYNAFFANHIIDMGALSEKDATNHEKSVYQKFITEKNRVLSRLKQLLDYNSTTAEKELSDEMQEYFDYIYDLLTDKNQEMLMKSKIDQKDSIYLSYQNGQTSLSKFLQHAIANSWINLDLLGIGEAFYNTEELYALLLQYIEEQLKQDASFDQMIYSSLIYHYTLTGKEICLLLFDQGILPYNEEEIASLQNGTVSAYTFLREKIKSLVIKPSQLALDPSTGSIVITNVKTGEVLAMVSYPSYDNNRMANSVDADYFNELNNNAAKPFLNRPVQERTAPGSTFKLVTAATALEEKIVTPTEKIYDKVKFDKVDPSPTCYSNYSHGKVDIAHAIGVSCNYFFYEMGYRLSRDSLDKQNDRLGLKKLEKYASMFGFDATSGVELSEMEPHISDMDPIRSSTGQGTHNYTPAQIARYTAAIANQGTCFQLTLMDRIKDINGKTIWKNNPSIYKTVELQPETWDILHEGMYLVANGPKSTIKQYFKDLDVTVAGKTGTAQLLKTRGNHALFTSYAPYNHPEISLTVVIPYAYTSSNAVMTASDIYEYYFGVQTLAEILGSDGHAVGANGAATD